MKLKCIGGPFNNEYREISDDYKFGDAYKIINIKPFYETIRYYVYIVDILKTNKCEIKFLRYKKLTIETILLQILT